MTRTIAAAAACLAGLLIPAPAAAQGAGADQRHRLEAAVGGLWIGGGTIGGADADLRANRMPPGDFRLFATETDAAASAGFDARVGYWLTRTIAVEGGVVFARPALRTRITSDAEGAAPLDVEEQLDQYFFDASVVVLLDALRFGGRTVPFVSGGAGYLRQLHEGRTFIESGQVYHAGAGLRHWLRTSPAGFLRGLGVRIDGRLYVLANGAGFDESPRPHGAVSGALFLTF
jgi:hypothetical protein